MLSLNIQSGDIYLQDIRQDDLPDLLEWYNRVDEFLFATGVDKPINLGTLTKRYYSTVCSSNEFFAGICNRENRMVGILKGRLQCSKNKSAVWISSIAIDPACRNRGYGRAAISLLLGYLKSNSNIGRAYLAVVEENLHGRIFWTKQNFKALRRFENCVNLQGQARNILIMYKIL